MSKDDQVALARALDELNKAKRRVERDAARLREQTQHELVLKLLPVLDNLDRSIDAARADDPMRRGVELVRQQFESVLVSYGLERMTALGEAFDPRVHEAVAVEPVLDPALDGVVVEQWQPGYRLGDKLLRPALVKVGRAAA